MLLYWFSFLVLFTQAVDASRPAQRQGDAPRFEDYPAGKIFNGKPPKVDFPPDFPQHEFFKVSIQDLVDGGVNFAARYAVREWSCGTNCRWLVILDMRTGKFLRASPYGTLSLTEEQFARHERDWVQIRADSRLLIATGCFDIEDPKKPIECGTKYFKLDKAEFALIRNDAKPPSSRIE